MSIVKNILQYDEENIIFNEPIKNNIINDSNFIKINYSTDYFVLNGIYLLITINNFVCEKYYNKYKYIFNIHTHHEMIESIKKIEENILKKININKIPSYKIYEQLKKGNINFNINFNLNLNLNSPDKNTCNFILKISGIWETQNNYGLTYKYMI